LHFVTQTISFVTTFVVVELFIFIFALLWLLSWKKLRQDVGKDIAKYGYVIILIIFMIFIFEISGVFMNLWALSLGPASLVFSTEGFQSLFVFIIAVLLSIFYPKIIKEEIDRKNILLKISALILMMSGIVILYLL